MMQLVHWNAGKFLSSFRHNALKMQQIINTIIDTVHLYAYADHIKRAIIKIQFKNKV